MFYVFTADERLLTCCNFCFLSGTSMSGRLRTNNAIIAGGLIAVIAVGALFPFYFTRQGPRARHAGHASYFISLPYFL